MAKNYLEHAASIIVTIPVIGVHGAGSTAAVLKVLSQLAGITKDLNQLLVSNIEKMHTDIKHIKDHLEILTQGIIETNVINYIQDIERAILKKQKGQDPTDQLERATMSLNACVTIICRLLAVLKIHHHL